MKELQIDWVDFVKLFQEKKIKPYVFLDKGHALMKSKFAPFYWRIGINVMTWLSILAFPTAIILFFYIKWWIPTIIIIFAFMFIKAIREEGAKAVIEISLIDSAFYNHSILSGTMIIYELENTIEI